MKHTNRSLLYLFFVNYPISVISFVVTIYVLLHPISTDGGEFLFTIPLVFFICSVVFHDIVRYQTGGFGLKVFYAIIILRYLVLPLWCCVIGSFSYGGQTAYALDKLSFPDGYRYAICATNIELIISLLTIRHYYPKEYFNISRKKETSFNSQRFSIFALAFIFITLLFVVSRGGLGGFLRFGLVSSKFDVQDIQGNHGIDVVLMPIMISFLVVLITSYFKRRDIIKHSVLNFIIPLFVGLLSCLIVVGNTRMTLLYYAFSAIAVLQYSFPNYKKKIYAIIIPTLLLMLVTFTLVKNYGYSGDGNQTIQNGGDEYIDVAAYVCGVENIAHTYDIHRINGDKFNFNTFLSDVFNYNYLLTIPPLNSLKSWVEFEPTTVDIGVAAQEMISCAGMALFYGQGVFGGILYDMLFFYIITRLLVYFEIKSKLGSSLGEIYINTWCSILFGVSMCYCVVTLWSNITYQPLFLYMLLTINSRFKKVNFK